MHFRSLNDWKVKYGESVREKVSLLEPIVHYPIGLKYTLYLPRRGTDLMNVGSVVDKFFCDCLVKAGIIPDDNCEYLNSVRFYFGGWDKENPRAIVEIIPRV